MSMQKEYDRHALGIENLKLKAELDKLRAENQRTSEALVKIADDHFVAEYSSEYRKCKKIAKEAIGDKVGE